MTYPIIEKFRLPECSRMTIDGVLINVFFYGILKPPMFITHQENFLNDCKRLLVFSYKFYKTFIFIIKYTVIQQIPN